MSVKLTANQTDEDHEMLLLKVLLKAVSGPWVQTGSKAAVLWQHNLNSRSTDCFFHEYPTATELHELMKTMKWRRDPQHVSSSGSSPVQSSSEPCCGHYRLSSCFLSLSPSRHKEIQSVVLLTSFSWSRVDLPVDSRTRRSWSQKYNWTASITRPLTASHTCPWCWFHQSQPTRGGSFQRKPPRSS